MDAARFARNLEDTYRQLHQQSCLGRRARQPAGAAGSGGVTGNGLTVFLE